MQRENLVLVHSFPTNSILLAGLIQYLEGFFKVYAIDLPGFTQESDPLPDISLEGYCRFVENKIVEQEFPTYIAAGISFGFLVVNSVAHDHRCKGIIAMEPYLGFQSHQAGPLAKHLAAALVSAICRFKLFSAIWNSRAFRAYMSRGAPKERIQIVLEQIDPRTFFETLRALLNHRSEICFHDLPYVLVANPNDRSIKYDYVRGIFEARVKEKNRQIVNTTIPHYPVELTETYFCEKMPEETVNQILDFIHERWLDTSKKIRDEHEVTELIKAKLEQTSRFQQQRTLDLSYKIIDVPSMRAKDLEGGLEGANLAHTSMRGIVLRNWNLKAVNLREADLRPAMGGGRSILSGSDLTRAQLQGAQLLRANLQDAILIEVNPSETRSNNDKSSHEPGTNLIDADLSRAKLNRAHLEGANLAGASLKEADLTGAYLHGANLAGVDLTSAVLSQTHLSHDCLDYRLAQEVDKKYGEARDLYVQLKRNFEEIGDYEAASWAYVRERVMSRRLLRPATVLHMQYNCQRKVGASAVKHYLRHGWKWFSPRKDGRWIVPYAARWLASLAIGTFTGYGEQPERTILLAAVTVVIYTVLYWALGGINDSCGWIDNLRRMSGGCGNPTAWRDCFLYSLGAFCTITFDDLVATSSLIKVLTSLEAITGVASLAIFTAALSQRIGSR